MREWHPTRKGRGEGKETNVVMAPRILQGLTIPIALPVILHIPTLPEVREGVVVGGVGQGEGIVVPLWRRTRSRAG